MSGKKIIYHHIRNSTDKITYNGVKILIDPFLAPKEYFPGFGSSPTLEQKKKRVPLVNLPMSKEEVVKKSPSSNNYSYTLCSFGRICCKNNTKANSNIRPKCF